MLFFLKSYKLIPTDLAGNQRNPLFSKYYYTESEDGTKALHYPEGYISQECLPHTKQ